VLKLQCIGKVSQVLLDFEDRVEPKWYESKLHKLNALLSVKIQ